MYSYGVCFKVWALFNFRANKNIIQSYAFMSLKYKKHNVLVFQLVFILGWYRYTKAQWNGFDFGILFFF